MKQNVYDYSFEMRRQRKRKFSLVLLVIVSVVSLLTLFINFVLFPVYVGSDSMESDIKKNGAVFVCPLVRSPKRGDVMYIYRQDNKEFTFFESVANAVVNTFSAQRYQPFGYTTNITGKPCLRRVLALPGDTVYMKDYVLYVKPAGQNYYLTEFELTSKPYNIHIYSVPAEWNDVGLKGDFPETVLAADEYFVLSDNRIESTDSRIWGNIKRSSIKGKVLMQYFPLTRIRFY